MKHYSNQFLLTLILSLFSITIFCQTTIFDYGSSWSYYDLQNEPAVQGSFDWNDISFDDSPWSSGNGQLGYGDGDEATTINSSTLTGYFRHSFNVSNPSNYDSLNLNLLFDDGAIVYLNGVEVWRINMPGGSVSYGTFSSAVGTENGIASNTVVSSLVTGTNVIAIEVHQASAGSSDISFDFRLEGNAPGAVNVIRGPYLQKGTTSSVVVRWRTATPTESVIDYGTTLGNLGQNFTDSVLKTEHEVELSSLTANTVYYYQISNATAILVPEALDMYFKTHPVVGSTDTYRFWALGDAGTANNNQRAVRDAYYNYIGSSGTDGILFLGDNAYNDGTDIQYQNAVFQNMYEDKLKNSLAWSTLGNHDGHSADSNSQTGPYYDIFTFPTAGESGGMASGTEAYYSFDYGNIHFIVLDSYETDRSVGSAMFNWAQSDIQNTTQEWIIAFWHHPPYTKGSHDSDTEGQLIDMRQNFSPMLESNGVDLVLSGHSHSYERSYFLNGHYGTSGTFNSSTHTVGTTGFGDGKTDGTGAYNKGSNSPEGAVYITAGSSGKVTGTLTSHNAMYASLYQLGSCVLEVTGSTLNLKFLRETGEISDYFNIEKGCTQGTSCDDGDPCTVNDVFDANCDCAGTPDTADTDNDGVCDTADLEINSPCPLNVDSSGVSIDTDSDGIADCLDQEVNSPCPNNVDANGVTLDTDNDGVCDTNDLEINSPCPLNVDSSGVSIDTDSDGIADCLDQEVNSPCPNNVDANGVSLDTDNDGVCDDDDICAGGNDNVDTDNDGIPDFCDTSTCLPNTSNFATSTLSHSGAGSSNTSTNIATDGRDIAFTISGLNQKPGGKKNQRYIEEVTITYIDGGGINQTYGVFDAGSASSVAVNISGLVQSVQVSLADAYDGNSSTILSVNLSVVDFCVEVVQCDDIDGDGICDPDDQCPGFDDNIDTDGDGIPDGCDPCNDLVDTDSDGVSDCIDLEINSPCPSTVDANGISRDTDGDGVCDELDQCSGFDDNIDTDGDGIPDGCDSCDNNLISTSCDDGDACTENDVYDANCNCVGTPAVDNDGDGYCGLEDPNDNDSCIPDAGSPTCITCGDIISDSFESNFGNWNDGGNDVARNTSNANTGVYSVRLRDNTGNSSSIFSDTLDLSTYNEVSVEFSYLTNSMENGEDFFLEISSNGGSSYSIVQTWVSGTDFSNNTRYNEVILVSGPFTSNTVFRIRCDASQNNDQVYIDDVVITDCISQPLVRSALSLTDKENYDLDNSIKIYPNPVSQTLFIQFGQLNNVNVEVSLYSVTGQLVHKSVLNDLNNQIQQIKLNRFSDGLYILRVTNNENGNILKTERIVIKNNQ